MRASRTNVRHAERARVEPDRMGARPYELERVRVERFELAVKKHRVEGVRRMLPDGYSCLHSS